VGAPWYNAIGAWTQLYPSVVCTEVEGWRVGQRLCSGKNFSTLIECLLTATYSLYSLENQTHITCAVGWGSGWHNAQSGQASHW